VSSTFYASRKTEQSKFVLHAYASFIRRDSDKRYGISEIHVTAVRQSNLKMRKMIVNTPFFQQFFRVFTE